MPGYPCCCGPVIPTVNCPNFIDNKAPQFPLITLPAGSSKGSCFGTENCGVFAGDYEPTWVTGSGTCHGFSQSGCVWLLTGLSFPICTSPNFNGNSLCLHVFEIAGPLYVMQVTINGTGGILQQWRLESPTKYTIGTSYNVPDNTTGVCSTADVVVYT